MAGRIVHDPKTIRLMLGEAVVVQELRIDGHPCELRQIGDGRYFTYFRRESLPGYLCEFRTATEALIATFRMYQDAKLAPRGVKINGTQLGG